MELVNPISGIDLLSTCPPRKYFADDRSYLQEVIDVAQWSEQAGYRGILIYTAHTAPADPWLLAHLIVQNTRHLSPLVALQPVYMHPYTAAKLITSFGQLYNRRIDLNMVAGGFRNDLTSLGDQTPHDARYDRLVEYASIIKLLLTSPSAIAYAGTYYNVDHLRLEPSLPQELLPRFFVSGSSTAGLAAARRIGAVAMQYPSRSDNSAIDLSREPIGTGLRVGVIARGDDDHAWEAACKRFPEDRKGQVTHMLAMSASDSVWHQRLSEMGSEGSDQVDITGNRPSPYWLGPFENYQEYCPYLVGSYARVADELARHIAGGRTTFILDVPADSEEAAHVNLAFNLALKLAGHLSAE